MISPRRTRPIAQGLALSGVVLSSMVCVASALGGGPSGWLPLFGSLISGIGVSKWPQGVTLGLSVFVCAPLLVRGAKRAREWGIVLAMPVALGLASVTVGHLGALQYGGFEFRKSLIAFSWEVLLVVAMSATMGAFVLANVRRPISASEGIHCEERRSIMLGWRVFAGGIFGWLFLRVFDLLPVFRVFLGVGLVAVAATFFCAPVALTLLSREAPERRGQSRPEVVG
jgi:hypothetical protein